VTVTAQPSAASARATARPIPLVPPVTIARRPEKVAAIPPHPLASSVSLAAESTSPPGRIQSRRAIYFPIRSRLWNSAPGVNTRVGSTMANVNGMPETLWEQTRQPPWVKLLNAAGAGLRRLGVRWPRLNPERLMAAARRRTGLSDFGD